MAVPPGCTKPDQGGKVSATADSSSERSGVTRRSRHIFSFPNPVDELAARTVAGGVVLMVLLAFALGSPWVLVPIVYGFWARVAAGPTLSPLGQLATRVVVPALPLEPRLTPGPPKRFAQAMGMVLSTAAMLVWVTAGWGAARWVLLPLGVAASAEAGFGFCLGCRVFGLLIRAGVVPAAVCEDCGDLGRRHPELAHRAA